MLSSPAKAGTHTPCRRDVARLVIIECSVVMGPRLRGDDTEIAAGAIRFAIAPYGAEIAAEANDSYLAPSAITALAAATTSCGV